MRKSTFLIGVAATLSACGSSIEESSTNASSKATEPERPKPAYCFFQPDQTKGWTARIDARGNVVVRGKAYRSDPRYQAVLLPATVTGSQAELSPTIKQNDTGYASPDNWWPLTQTIANSQSVTTVLVKCGNDVIATLSVLRKK